VDLPLIVLVCGLVAALGAFALSASRRVEFDPVDPSVEERAVARSIEHRPRLRRFLRERLNRESAGGLMLTLGFVIVFVVALALGLLLDMVDEERGLARLDESVSEWGSEHATSRAVDVLEHVTELGSTNIVLVVLVGVAAFDYVGHRQASVFVFVAAVGLGQLAITNVIKELVDRERPNVLQLVETSGSSFPSGHSAAAAATWSAVALILSRGHPRVVRAAFAAGAVLVAVAVATSRALLGVHWVTDIVGGLAVGWGWFLLVAVVFGGRRQRLGDPVRPAPAIVGAASGDQVRSGAQSVSERGRIENSRRSVSPFVPPSSSKRCSSSSATEISQP
jgi:undecaprenyl-diphosphatase